MIALIGCSFFMNQITYFPYMWENLDEILYLNYWIQVRFDFMGGTEQTVQAYLVLRNRPKEFHVTNIEHGIAQTDNDQLVNDDQSEDQCDDSDRD